MADKSLFHISPFDAASSSSQALLTTSLNHWIMALNDDNTREDALRNLKQNKDIHESLGPLLWNAFGAISALLKELTSVYNILSTPNLTMNIAIRVCNVLFLLKFTASHPDTRKQFISAQMPTYIYPFLITTHTDRPHEYLRLSGLGVIGILAKDGDKEVIEYLLQSQVIPNCLSCMELGGEQSKSVALFIVHKILMHDVGLKYFSLAGDRFYILCNSLEIVTRKVIEEQFKSPLKYIIACYLRLLEIPRAKNVFRASPQMSLRNYVIINLLQDDPETLSHLQQFINNVDHDLPPA